MVTFKALESLILCLFTPSYVGQPIHQKGIALFLHLRNISSCLVKAMGTTLSRSPALGVLDCYQGEGGHTLM